MFKLHSCPKCHGDLYVGADVHGSYLSCIQCGRYFDVTAASGRVAEAVKTAPPAVPPPAELELAA